MWSGHTSASIMLTCLTRKAYVVSFRFQVFFDRRTLVFGIWARIQYGTYNSNTYALNLSCRSTYISFHIQALVRMNIVRRFLFLGKTISFTSTPDYLGVLTHSAFADWLRQEKALIYNTVKEMFFPNALNSLFNLAIVGLPIPFSIFDISP